MLNVLLAAAAVALIFALIARGGAAERRKSGRETELRDEAAPGGAVITMYDHDRSRAVEMNLEEYVAGVLAAEMPASYAPEALKAQAVAIRTLAYKAMGGGAGCEGCDVCTDSTHCQAYAAEDERREMWGGQYDKWNGVILKAVGDTDGMIIEYGGQPIDVLYHAASDGMTEDSQNVFSSARPYLVGVESPDEGMVRETMTFEAREFTDRINEAFPDALIQADELAEQVVVRSRYASGRVRTVKVGGAFITGAQMRNALGLKSADFDISFDGDGITFLTRGYGHGVGMSQKGADIMAENGSDYIEILQHYYTGAEIIFIY